MEMIRREPATPASAAAIPMRGCTRTRRLYIIIVNRKAKDEPTASAYLPARLTLPKLREAAAGCRGCELHRRATQTVFGAGARKATVMLVGEQPGNDEDLAGEPFVGPAGRLLDRALLDAGINRKHCYVTNVVKHFKWVPRGKRRIHDKPNAREVAACRPWLTAEIEVVNPRVIVCLGATAAQALLGRQFKVTRERGKLLEVASVGAQALATVHPSAVLRAPDDQARHRELARLVADLKIVALAID